MRGRRDAPALFSVTCTALRAAERSGAVFCCMASSCVPGGRLNGMVNVGAFRRAAGWLWYWGGAALLAEIRPRDGRASARREWSSHAAALLSLYAGDVSLGGSVLLLSFASLVFSCRVAAEFLGRGKRRGIHLPASIDACSLRSHLHDRWDVFALCVRSYRFLRGLVRSPTSFSDPVGGAVPHRETARRRRALGWLAGDPWPSSFSFSQCSSRADRLCGHIYLRYSARACPSVVKPVLGIFRRATVVYGSSHSSWWRGAARTRGAGAFADLDQHRARGGRGLGIMLIPLRSRPCR